MVTYGIGVNHCLAFIVIQQDNWWLLLPLLLRILRTVIALKTNLLVSFPPAEFKEMKSAIVITSLIAGTSLEIEAYIFLHLFLLTSLSCLDGVTEMVTPTIAA